MNDGKLDRLMADNIRALLRSNTTYYVNGTTGHDNYDGSCPERAFATIGAATAVAGAGDRIIVAMGTYTENVTLASDGLELYGEPYAMIVGTLTISGNFCKVHSSAYLLIQSSGGTGVTSTGLGVYIERVFTYLNTRGFYINTAFNLLTDCLSIDDDDGFEFSQFGHQVYGCKAMGKGSGRGFYLSNASAKSCIFKYCHATNWGTGAGNAAFECIAGTSDNIFAHCGVGAGDRKVDAGTNTWAEFQIGSQIVPGQSREQDLADIYNHPARQLIDYPFNSPAAAVDTDFWTAGGDAGGFTVETGDGNDASRKLYADTAQNNDYYIHGDGKYALLWNPENQTLYSKVIFTAWLWMNTTADTQFLIGLFEAGSFPTGYAEPLVDCAHFFVDDGVRANYSCRSYDGAEEETDSGVALDTGVANIHRFDIEWDNAQVVFKIDSVVVATHTTRIPDSPMGMVALIRTQDVAGAEKSANIIRMKVQPII